MVASVGAPVCAVNNNGVLSCYNFGWFIWLEVVGAMLAGEDGFAVSETHRDCVAKEDKGGLERGL